MSQETRTPGPCGVDGCDVCEEHIHQPARVVIVRKARPRPFYMDFTEEELKAIRLEAAASALYEALKALTEACEADFTSPETEEGPVSCGDDESVDYQESPITFGMIRRARAALAAADGRKET